MPGASTDTPRFAVARIAGVVLAGGLSRRMGGGDKGLIDVGGQTILERVIQVLRSQADPVAINANGDPARFAQFELPVIADPIDGFVGPLAGVLAGLRWAATVDPGISHVVTASSDAPFLPSDLVARLADTATAGPGAIAIAQSDGHLHPVIGLWPVALADDLEAALGNGVRKVLHWTDRWGTEATPFPATIVGGEPCDPFFNANTPAELAEVRRLLCSAAT